ncbi:TIGR02453 family protein [Salipiger abyssi]|uniref:TIGR02453 family protein n=1 Tax=Salipiger abyssi TaxID=1250539 RepID=UPI001A8CF079|nr:TIGR02453 family protein [Salipiger abyssi]MBN9887882.1 TIGR02453 family protein [Salipiger abyssi]
MCAQSEVQAFALRARQFLQDLSSNNDHAWFRSNKRRYDTDVKRPAEHILTGVAAALAARSGVPVRSKLFRLHRDIRFSEDKSPYLTHLHAAWSAPDGRGWYFGLSPDYATAGAGMMRFDAEQTARWRAAVTGPAGVDLAAHLEGIGARLDPPALAEVPPPFTPDHPQAPLLRRTGCVLWRDDLFDSLSPDPAKALLSAFDRLAPLQDWLGAHL